MEAEQAHLQLGQCRAHLPFQVFPRHLKMPPLSHELLAQGHGGDTLGPELPMVYSIPPAGPGVVPWHPSHLHARSALSLLLSPRLFGPVFPQEVLPDQPQLPLPSVNPSPTS